MGNYEWNELLKNHLQGWKQMTKRERCESIETLFSVCTSAFKTEQLVFSVDMPAGYEDAFGTFDKEKSTLFFNEEMLANDSIEPLFVLLHELRHAVQYMEPQQFPLEVIQSLPYVILYNGQCYKYIDGTYKECYIEGTEAYLTNAYLSLPYEIDANRFAFDVLSSCIDSDIVQVELSEIASFFEPKEKLSFSELQKIFREIDDKVE